MIEAVNSVIANATLLRAQAEQSSNSARAIEVSAPPSVEGVNVPKAPYISPYIRLDLNYDTAVLQIRDSETGDVVRQFPSESRLQARQREVVSSNFSGYEVQDVNVPTDSAPGVAAAPSAPETNVSIPVPQAQVAAAALSAGAQAGQAGTTSVSVFA